MVASFSTRRGYHQHSLQLYYCCTHGTRHGHHGCLILVLTSSVSPVKKIFGRAHGLLTIAVAARYRCVKRSRTSRVVDHQQFWQSRHPRSSSLRLPARCFRLHRLSIVLHQSQLYFKPKNRTQHMSFTSSSTTNPAVSQLEPANDVTNEIA